MGRHWTTGNICGSPTLQGKYCSQSRKWRESEFLAVILAARAGTNGPVPRPFQTWKKNHTVKEELEHQSWTRGLWRMESISEMVSFTRLWDLVQNVHLTDVQDSITWKWTSNGEYTAKSAYQIFFFLKLKPTGFSIWVPPTTSVHHQLQCIINYRLSMRQWPCNPVCTLCNQEQEAATHLVLHCNFAKEVWERIRLWSGGLVDVPDEEQEVEDWWQEELANLPMKI